MDVFKKAHEITVAVYEITKTFPQDEKFALVSQMRRSAYSIPSNLMEGGHRLYKKEYRQFAGIAKGSVGELKYFLLLSKDLGYISEQKYLMLRESTEELSKMLGGLIKSLTDTDTVH
jgi:four helix bundle protein